MVLGRYSTPKEKSEHFLDYSVVNTKEEFDNLCAKLNKYERTTTVKYLFRGLNNASYKNYSSAQRLWIERDLHSVGITYRKYLSNLLIEAKKKDSILYSYFERLGIVRNDWLILSYLQHYGAPTPLIDFTKRYSVALYFALDDATIYGDENLNNYVSIYYFKAVDVARDIAPSIYKMASVLAEKVENWDEGLKIWKELSYPKVIDKHRLVLVPAYSHQSNIKNHDNKRVTIYTVANLNSSAQDGEFICTDSPDIPLEDMMVKYGLRYLSCIDIHKGLKEYILQNVLKFGSMDEAKKRYYPNQEDIASDIVFKALSR